jgi:hypothetical protein
MTIDHLGTERVYEVLNPPLSICSFSNCQEVETFSLETLFCSIPICVTFAFPEPMRLEIRKFIERIAKSVGTCTLKIKMGLGSIMLYLNKKDLAAIEIHTEINHALGEGTLGYSTVTRYLGKQNFGDSSILPQRTVKSWVLTQLTMLFCRRLMNSILRHFIRLPRESWFRCQLFDIVW